MSLDEGGPGLYWLANGGKPAQMQRLELLTGIAFMLSHQKAELLGKQTRAKLEGVMLEILRDQPEFSALEAPYVVAFCKEDGQVGYIEFDHKPTDSELGILVTMCDGQSVWLVRQPPRLVTW